MTETWYSSDQPLTRSEIRNLEKAKGLLEEHIGPVGAVTVISNLTYSSSNFEIEGYYHPTSRMTLLNKRTLMSLEIAMEGLLQGLIERLAESGPRTMGFELHMRRVLVKLILGLDRRQPVGGCDG